MDRRQQKTRAAIFKAFNKLLEVKRFDSITVQEIIDEANIGRSTFYAHFETKEELLKSMCTDIFTHVFSEELPREANHDFSSCDHTLKERICHILYHLQENKQNIKGIFSNESGDLFLKYFKQYVSDMFIQYIDNFKINAPADFVLNHLVSSFAETIKWWIANNMSHSPEEITEYYMSVIRF